ncbi:hypothetical protein PFHG_03598, partial [Plasmodium falciparum HB3]
IYIYIFFFFFFFFQIWYQFNNRHFFNFLRRILWKSHIGIYKIPNEINLWNIIFVCHINFGSYNFYNY